MTKITDRPFSISIIWQAFGERGRTVNARRDDIRKPLRRIKFHTEEYILSLVDQLLCNATESQLRNVLAMTNLTDTELIALFEREQQFSAKEDGTTIL